MLVVHRCADAATLAQALADVLAAAPGDPFAAEVVAVPAKGVERWLAQRLAHVLGATDGDGVCANVAFPWPSTLLDEAVQAVSPEAAAAVEQWAPRRCVWPLLEVIDASAPVQPWCRSLAHHLGSGVDDKGRRLTVARRLAGLFDDYGQSRPELLCAWAAGDDDGGDEAGLPDDLAWQAELWRQLRERLGTPHPAELLADACAALREHPERSGLPERLSVFGASRLSPARLRVLAALAAHRDVHLWLHHASPALWDAVRAAPVATRRRDDQARRSLGNPLLGSLSRDVLELQQLLARLAPGATDVLHEAPAGADTLLGRLKADLAADRVPETPPAHDPADRSVQVHACHGRTRQVEVLREVIVGLLAGDPTLEPRDVLIMCPDVETFAPIIAATFSLGADDEAAHPAARLRVRLADRALRQTNDLLAVLSQLLELGTARITASQLLDLAGAPAVRRRFGFDDDEIARLRDWVAAAGVRWGLDREHRRTWTLGDIEQGSWHAGLDRLLLGVAMEGQADSYGGVVPLDDVDSSDIDLAGRLAELVDRVAAAQDLMAGRHDVAGWLRGLSDAVLGLAATTYDTAWQQLQLRAELADIVEAAAGCPTQLGLADVRALLADTLAGRPTRAGFRTGTLTVCTLVPMRSVPHRVVCLLGLDDGVFPRQSVRDGDDLLARDPWVGERDPRSEDRQLLLDAICAAGDHLVVTYTGADERTGAPVPPSVPLGELLDALDRTSSVADGQRVRDAITTHHPLQPFDPRNFERARLGTPGPFSFDPLAHAGAVASVAPRREPPPLIGGPLAGRPDADVDLVDLQRLLAHPVRGFLRQRLLVVEARGEQEPSDAMSVELDGLARWQVGERLLAQRLAGIDAATCRDLELRRGSLPPGPLGARLLQQVGHDVEDLLVACADDLAEAPESLDVDVRLPDGTRLTGTVGGVRGEVVAIATYSRLGAGHRLRAWVDLLALSLTSPEPGWRAVAVGRGRSRPTRSELRPPPPGDRMAALAELVGVYRAGLREPLPLPLKTAYAYATHRYRGVDAPGAREAAEPEWVGVEIGATRIPGEREDLEHELLYGTAAPMSVLRQPPGPGERGPGWAPDETDRFGRLADRVWRRLLEAESAP